MKLTKLNHLVVLGLVLAIAAVGCRKKPTPLTVLPNQKPLVGEPSAADLNKGETAKTNPDDTAMSKQLEKGIESNPADLHKGWLENADTFKSDTVYFDYDSSVIKAGERSKVSSVADYLKGHNAEAVRVEGNCDERGTEEYNRALGERRALAVREELVRLGIDPNRVDTISYGKDKPAEPGHDESAWRKNRRDDFILLTPPAAP